PAVEGERLAENIFVPVDIADPAVIRLAARLAMAKGGNVLVGAIAAGPGELDDARARAREGELVASAVGAEASSIVRVDTSAAAAIEAIVAEHGVTLVLTGWRRSALAADVVLGGQHAELVAIADVPVLTVLTAGADYRRVVLAFDEDDIGGHAAERDLAVALAGIAASGARGRAVVIAPSDEVARDVAAQVGEDTEAIGDGRSRREALAALAREDDLVLVPARPGGSPLHRDALALASLPVDCTVAVPARAHSVSALVTGTPTLVGSRAG
ncbi:MAG TPA: hypothetical protein VEW90_08390, partial [Gaiellaceae bacterium]|nr:hypothetical protein [Gaiellaceae bacterium]